MSNDKIREALEFYASDDVWHDEIRVVAGPNGPEEQRLDIPAIDRDLGDLARAALAELDAPEAGMPYVDIVFDGPPSHESGRFVEAEGPRRESVNIGEWIDRGDGCWALRIPLHATELDAPAAEPAADLREALAEYAHDAWCEWMNYLFSKAYPTTRGYRITPPDACRWQRQALTQYADLPEREKESDRSEADKMLAVIRAHRCAGLTADDRAFLRRQASYWEGISEVKAKSLRPGAKDVDDALTGALRRECIGTTTRLREIARRGETMNDPFGPGVVVARTVTCDSCHGDYLVDENEDAHCRGCGMEICQSCVDAFDHVKDGAHLAGDPQCAPGAPRLTKKDLLAAYCAGQANASEDDAPDFQRWIALRGEMRA